MTAGLLRCHEQLLQHPAGRLPAFTCVHDWTTAIHAKKEICTRSAVLCTRNDALPKPPLLHPVVFFGTKQLLLVHAYQYRDPNYEAAPGHGKFRHGFDLGKM